MKTFVAFAVLAFTLTYANATPYQSKCINHPEMGMFAINLSIMGRVQREKPDNQVKDQFYGIDPSKRILFLV